MVKQINVNPQNMKRYTFLEEGFLHANVAGMNRFSAISNQGRRRESKILPHGIDLNINVPSASDMAWQSAVL